MKTLQQLFAFLLVTFLFFLLVQRFLYPETQIMLRKRPDVKYILYWTGMWEQKDFYLGFGSEPFRNCQHKNCFATDDRNLIPIEEFDAVLFHGVEYSVITRGMPRDRSPEQVYVYVNMEPPPNSPWRITVRNFFNWTMSYRSDSEIVRSYGTILKEPTNYEAPTIEEIKNRTRKIAWMVSNCDTPSRRHELYQKINRFIPVDVYGKCGTLKCPRSTTDQCYALVEAEYKFYLAFENAFCQDYVTEKLFRILKRDVIPIVYGAADYDTVAPRKSVIDVKNYDSVQDLIDHLNYLDENPDEYLKYFEWKRSYFVKPDESLAVCALCEKLNEPKRTRKVYGEIRDWWDEPDTCKYNTQLPKIVYS